MTAPAKVGLPEPVRKAAQEIRDQLAEFGIAAEDISFTAYPVDVNGRKAFLIKATAMTTMIGST